MTLSPDADKAQVRQAVIEHEDRMREIEDRMEHPALYAGSDYAGVLSRLEEAERRLDLLSNALKSTLTSREEPKSGPVSITRLQVPASNHRPEDTAVTGGGYRPHGDGDKFWKRPDNVLIDVSEVPPEALERFQREKGTPRPEYPPEEA